MMHAGVMPHPISWPPMGSVPCSAPLLPTSYRAAGSHPGLSSRSPTCSARGGPAPEITLECFKETLPTLPTVWPLGSVDVLNLILSAALLPPAEGDEQGAIKMALIVIAARLLLAANLEYCKASSVPARAALSAALVARNAVIEGDTEVVDAFSRTWLGLSRPAAWREAVEVALLGDWVEALGQGLATDAYIRDLLHRHTSSEHRALQPLWARRVRGKRTALLSQPLGPDLTVEALIVERHTPEEAALVDELDSRLLSVLSGLAADEAVLARAWAASGESWDRTAYDAGLPAGYGERVRRKLRRLGARHTARAAAADTVAGTS